MLTGAGASRAEALGAPDVGRVCAVTTLAGRTIVSVEGPEGPIDVVVPVAPDVGAAAAGAAGLRRLQWVRLVLDGPSPHARLAGTTRQPQVRTLSLAAGLALAARGLPAVVTGQGS